MPSEQPTIEHGRSRHPSITHLLQFFRADHLPDNLRMISEPFCELAFCMADALPENPETAVALRKLLEAKDAAVRSMVSQ